MWSGGISNPLSVIEQLTYLQFVKRLDELHTLKEAKAARTRTPIEEPVFSPGQDGLRWSRFKETAPEQMFETVSKLPKCFASRPSRFIVITQEVPADASCDARRSGLNRVPSQMRVARRRLYLGVPEQFPDHGQALAESQRTRGKTVSQIVDPHVLEARLLADAPPGALQVGEVRAGEAARDDPGSSSRGIVVVTGNG